MEYLHLDLIYLGYATTGSIANLIGYNDISVTGRSKWYRSVTTHNKGHMYLYTPPIVDVSDLTDTTNLLSGGTAYTDSDVDPQLNTSTATNGQVPSWNGTDYVWTTNTGGGGARTYLDNTSYK